MKNGNMTKAPLVLAADPRPGGDASTSGAASGAPVNNTGAAKEPGAVQKGVNKQ